jgi:uncharacterized protein (DUF2236 family)
MATARRSGPPVTSAGDLERLRAAIGRKRIDVTRSLYGPASVTWRINREAVVLLGGGRALLLQVAHPLIAAGVAAHSRYRTEPLQRLWRTLDLMRTITFGNALEAIAAVRAIEAVHKRVRGALDAGVGPFARGTRYDANDPALQLWVYATLIDTALLVYERFVAPLPDATKEAYYEEAKSGLRLFAIPARLIPRRFADFQDYVRDVTDGETLAVGPAAYAIAASILRPPLPLGVQQALQSLNLFTIGLLPPALRMRYGLSWNRVQETLLHGVATSAQYLLPLLPGPLRSLPHARQAQRPDASPPRRRSRRVAA